MNRTNDGSSATLNGSELRQTYGGSYFLMSIDGQSLGLPVLGEPGVAPEGIWICGTGLLDL